MDRFTKRVKSQEEKNELLRLAKQEWDEAGEFAHLLGDDQENYLQKTADNIIVEAERIEPRALTPMEKAALDDQQGRLEIFGGKYADKEYSAIPAIAELERAQEEAGLQKLLGPADRAESQLESLVRGIVQKTVGNLTVPVRESDREGLAIMPRLAAATQGDDSDAAKFLRAFVSNDEKGMRRVARELAMADAA